MKTLQRSGGFQEVAAFGDDKQVRIFRVGDGSAGDGGAGEASLGSGLRMVDAENVEVVHASEALPDWMRPMLLCRRGRHARAFWTLRSHKT